ncbi:MAG: hypothetical protein LBM07_04325 [Culturomica sp.]|jgi:hypothetical protein|nr:hypothetical protein [Culturomica sp.]
MAEKTEKEDSVLNELKFKVDRLIKLYRNSLEVINEQKEKIEELSVSIGNLEAQNAELDEKLKNAKIATGLMSENKDDNSRQAKLQINRLVREIDKCIALLNN